MAPLKNWEALARAAAAKHGLNPNVFVRQIRQESGGDPNAGSSAGAQGIAQFMPATARGLGIDPNNPVQALNGAAKLMAGYVKKYGGYEPALRAYNAGEGAIEKSKGYGETNHYVQVILGGKDPGKLRKPSSGAVAAATTIKTPGTSRVVATQTQQFDQAGYDRASKLVALKGVLAGFNGGRSSGILASVLPDSADPAAFAKTVNGTKTVTTPGKTITIGGAKAASSSPTATGGTKVPGLAGKGSGLLELIYNNGGKGYGVKDKKIVDGQSVFNAVWAGHANHVHVAAGKKTVVGLGKLAQEMGLHVGENSHFGGENPASHVPGSYHNKDEAIDVSGDKAKMEAYAKRVRKIYFGK